jgi:hypothetical protein
MLILSLSQQLSNQKFRSILLYLTRPILHMVFLIILYNYLNLLMHCFSSPFLKLLTCQVLLILNVLLFLNSLISLSSLCVMSLTFQEATLKSLIIYFCPAPWSVTFQPVNFIFGFFLVTYLVP